VRVWFGQDGWVHELEIGSPPMIMLSKEMGSGSPSINALLGQPCLQFSSTNLAIKNFSTKLQTCHLSFFFFTK